MPWTPEEQLAFAKRLREQRRARGLTQEALAHDAGLSVRRVALLESGTSNPRTSTLFAIADVLGIDAADLLKASPQAW